MNGVPGRRARPPGLGRGAAARPSLPTVDRPGGPAADRGTTRSSLPHRPRTSPPRPGPVLGEAEEDLDGPISGELEAVAPGKPAPVRGMVQPVGRPASRSPCSIRQPAGSGPSAPTKDDRSVGNAGRGWGRSVSSPIATPSSPHEAGQSQTRRTASPGRAAVQDDPVVDQVGLHDREVAGPLDQPGSRAEDRPFPAAEVVVRAQRRRRRRPRRSRRPRCSCRRCSRSSTAAPADAEPAPRSWSTPRTAGPRRAA